MKLPIPPRFSDPTLEQHFLRIQQELEQASSRTWYLDRDVEHPHSLTVRGNLQLSDTTAVTEILDEDNFSSDSATALATQQSIKAYVDSASSSSLDELSDVTLSSLATGDLLRYNGSGWVNATLADAGISATGHTHVIADVTGLQTALDGKASSSHTHAFSEITATPTTLAGYGITDAASSSHTHAFSEITATPTTLAGYGITDAASSSHTHAFSEITSTPTTLSGYGITDAASSSHTHALDDLSDVTITTVASGEFLKWSGSAWINSTTPSGVTQVSAGAGLTTSPDPIESTGTVSMDLLGLQTLSDPGANKVPFYRNAGSTFDWLLFDSNDFQYSTSTTLSLASGAVGFNTAGSGLVASGAANDTVSVKYTSGSNLIDGAGAGSIDGADYILFQDDSDSSIVKKDTVANLPFVDAVAGTAPIASSGGTSPTISLNYTVGLKNSGSNLVVDIETNTHDFDSSAGDTMDASDIVMLFDRGSDVNSSAGGTYVARLDELDLNLMNNSNAGFTKNAFNAAGDGLAASGSTLNVDYDSTSNVVSDANDGTGDTVDAANDRMLIYNVTPDTAGEYVQFININQLPFPSKTGSETISGDWTVTGEWTFSDNFKVESATPYVIWDDTGAATDEGYWRLGVTSGFDFALQSRTDGGGTGVTVFSAQRGTGTAVNAVDFYVNIRPDTDGGSDLGTNSFRWGTAYIDDMTLTNALSVGNGGTGSTSFANDELLIGGGGTNAVTTDSNLSFSGGSSGQLNAPFFSGDGSLLTGVSASQSTVTDLTTETNTYYPMMTDGTSGSVSHFVDASELSYTSSTDTLNLVSATLSGDLTVDTSTLVVDSTNDRVGITTASPYSSLDLGSHGGSPLSMISWHANSTTSYAHIWASRSGARLTLGHGVMGSDSVNNGFEYSTSNTWARSAIELSYGQINFFCNPADSGTYGNAVAMDNRMYLSTTGFKVDVGSDHFQIVRDSASTARLELNNSSGDRGYLQANDAGAVTLATQVAGGQINLRDNGNALNLIQADYNGTDTVRINSNGNNSFAINATGTATSATMRWRFGGTDEARIQWLDSSNQLRVRLEDSSDRMSVFIGGASSSQDRRFDIRGIADHKGVVAVENAQFYVDEDNTSLSISSGVVTCNWDRGNQLHLDLDSTVTEIDIVDNGMYAGGSYILMISEGTSAPASVTWTTTDTLYWANGDEPVLNAGDLNDITVVQFFKTEAGDDLIIGSWFMAQ